MANNSKNEESSPLLSNQSDPTTITDQNNTKSTQIDTKQSSAESGFNAVYGWTADGLPLTNGVSDVVGEPLPRGQWNSGLFACLGRSDHFCSSDLEVCLLGSVAPCVIHGSNVERLASSPGTFANHCLPYTALFLMGNAFFGWNCMAPFFSYPTRTTIRRKFNLEGNWEAMSKSCGGCCDMDEGQMEQAEMACDFATHICCHRCALCQEGREIRRRLPHPGFGSQPMLVMIPPGDQTMARVMLKPKNSLS